MLGVRLALTVVLLFAVACVCFGIVGGLQSDITAGVKGRPYIYWLMSPCIGFVAAWVWPIMISWYVRVRLPAWHERFAVSPAQAHRLLERRFGEPILETAAMLQPRERLGFAAGLLLYGLWYVLLAVPLPFIFGMSPIGTPALRPEEAIPLAACLLVPVGYTALLVAQQIRRA